ncbi:hypothetical protein ACK3BK_21745 [Pseudomonas sp. L7]|uniref:hypothetical protein n=1 Tax=Pseudomonas sp. L7 TaxID=3388343 RepID=UPI0039853610
MADTDRETLLAWLGAHAEESCKPLALHESSRGKALACALLAFSLVLVGGWLASLPAQWQMQSGQWLLWGPGVLLLVAGVAGLALAEGLRRRHGKCVLSVTDDCVLFANSHAPTPLYCFDGFEIDQRHLSMTLVFSLAAISRAPQLAPACFKSLVAPDAWPVAGGLRVKLWVCTPVVDGRRVDMQALTDRLYVCMEAAQARRTLGQLGM